jgi:CheY-like chemotaxis protein
MNSVQHANRAPLRWMKTIRAQLEVLRSGTTATVRAPSRVRCVPDNPFPDRPRILVVDDCPVSQLVVAAMLWRWEITPLVAADGAEAVALACGQDFDLILMDLQMPVLDGLTATRQLRRFELEHACPRAPVVAYTSSPFGVDEQLLRACGIDASLEKPCNTRSLEACLTRWCGHTLQVLANQPAG